MKKNEAKKAQKTKNRYVFDEIEPKWQRIWQEGGIYQPDLETAKKNYYNLMMFPYPSAEGLHVGNMYAMTGADLYGRFQRMRGHDVVEPIGLDGFGIHSENYALKVGRHPMEQAKISEENFYSQMLLIGNSFAWNRRIETYDSEYYKWTQWIFTELFKAGLAYRQKSPVNFCPHCKTVVADEQVIDGKCERCGTVVEKQDLEQWFFKITDYAEQLLNNLEKLDWSEKVKIAQKNWIGKSEGAKITFRIKNYESRIKVFTTRPDTLYGATFLVVSPEHELVAKLLTKELRTENLEQVRKYVEHVCVTSEEERRESKEKTGVFSGLYALNPVTRKEIPIWIADYVLMGYGTGAIMAVPAHDERDFEFAKKQGLPIVQVIASEEELDIEKEAFVGEGKIMNSQEWNGWKMPKEIGKVINWLEKKEIGKRETTYHLRDWLISRQRYWGPPIPMIYCEDCAKQGKSWFTNETKNKEQRTNNNKNNKVHSPAWDAAGWYPVEEKDLPVKLPFVKNYKPLGTGKAPLASYPEFYETTCPHCGRKARRETDVSDTFLDSAWYFFRYTSTERDDVAFDRQIVKKWLPVNMYIGGAEHAVLHLLYARFMTMFFKDRGLISFDEPFTRFYAHGLIIKDGAKMSKSKGNVIVPDTYIKKFGADSLRSYLMFLGPFNEGGDFRDSGIEGMHKFLKRVWTMFQQTKNQELSTKNDQAIRMMHKTIKGVTEDMQQLRYNTALAKLMTYYNFLYKKGSIEKQEAITFLKLFAPFAPHLAEELWERLGEQYSIHTSSWPVYDTSLTQEERIPIVVQINGKLRDTLEIEKENVQNQKSIEALARESEKVQRYLTLGTVKRVIYVPGRILNFVME